jgi:hypothetical protein
VFSDAGFWQLSMNALVPRVRRHRPLDGNLEAEAIRPPASARVRLLRASADHRFNARLYFDSIADHGARIRDDDCSGGPRGFMRSRRNRLRRRPLPASRRLHRPRRSNVDGAAAGNHRHRHRRHSRARRQPPQPTTRLAREGLTAIFNGKGLSGWQALIDIGTLKYGAGLNPADLLKLSPAEKADRQKESNAEHLKHWSVVDGILIFDGVQADKLTTHVEKGGQNLQTVKESGDVELYVDWCIEAAPTAGCT